MLLAFLRSSYYDRMVRLTQYTPNKYYDSDSDADEENQYEIIEKTNPVVKAQYGSIQNNSDSVDTPTDIKQNSNKPTQPDFRPEDYYCVDYHSSDSLEMKIVKNSINYGAVVFLFLTYIFIGYVVANIYAVKKDE